MVRSLPRTYLVLNGGSLRALALSARSCTLRGARLGNVTLHITADDEADTLLSNNPLALLIGMLLDQQIA